MIFLKHFLIFFTAEIGQIVRGDARGRRAFVVANFLYRQTTAKNCYRVLLMFYPGISHESPARTAPHSSVHVYSRALAWWDLFLIFCFVIQLFPLNFYSFFSSLPLNSWPIFLGIFFLYFFSPSGGPDFSFSFLVLLRVFFKILMVDIFYFCVFFRTPFLFCLVLYRIQIVCGIWFLQFSEKWTEGL